MRSKRPGWAAAGRRSSLISALSGRRRFPVDFDELDETFDAEVGERHDAVVAEPLEHPAAGQRRAGVQQIDKDLRRADVALKEYRSKGEQKMTVQHVRVAEGGQAIVGNVNATPEGVGARMHWPMHQALRCHATSKRSGKPCRSPAVRSHSVCRMHGAGGGAPKGNKNALKHGLYTAEAIETRRMVADLTRQARETVKMI
jgi:hypothetical protein